ncbi:MAG: hypothetical protein KBA97_01755 [Methanothrix sp.]|nr:hypothetical protein [Methanothrix sp.]
MDEKVELMEGLGSMSEESVYRIWVHGTSVQMEREGYFISKQRTGNGTIFRTHNDEWFHFSIPNADIFGMPSDIFNTPMSYAFYGYPYIPRLKKIYVLYKTTLTTKIKEVSVVDGQKIIKTFWGDKWGDHSHILDQGNTWDVGSVCVDRGLGISVHVDFGPANNVGVPEIVFISAGAEFELGGSSSIVLKETDNGEVIIDG